ncbi:trans-aconitate methyltransferase 1 [Basidiobolus ranarum]|uniref:Trans-aconitate methyltransferase 1 n=1 Tax=Basidiobolus ranarum TaxID=34480 RepID=A0ABR2VLS1_9FUNG
MSTFSKVAYNSKAYAQFRPSYTNKLYRTIYDFHKGGYSRALDVATGTGQVTKALSSKFEQVHGIDISETMLSQATKGDNITYSIGSAEQLPFEDASVDLITVAQGAHWFNTKIEGSSEKVRNSVEELGVNPVKLGNNWEAGREILDNFYRDSGWEELHNEFSHVLRYESPRKDASALDIPDDNIFIQLRSMEVWRFREYLKTWSSYKQYKEANLPGDLVDECVDSIKKEYNPRTPLKEDDVLPLSWPQVLLLASNR